MSDYKYQFRDKVSGALIEECYSYEEAKKKVNEPKFKNTLAWVMKTLTNSVRSILKPSNLEGLHVEYDDPATIEEMVKR